MNGRQCASYNNHEHENIKRAMDPYLLSSIPCLSSLLSLSSQKEERKNRRRGRERGSERKQMKIDEERNTTKSMSLFNAI